MTDTPPEITELVRQKLMACSGEERFLMGVRMFDAARDMVLASLPASLPPEELRNLLFSRLYGQRHPARRAFFDPSRTHRFWLKREWDAGKPTVVFVMLNPSNGDETENDMTIKRCINKARYNGFGALEIVNLYSRVTPYPKELWQARKAGICIVHPENDRWMAETCQNRTVVLACGGKAKVSRLQEVLVMLKARSIVPKCVGKTSGTFPMPKHPLSVCDNLTFTDF